MGLMFTEMESRSRRFKSQANQYKGGPSLSRGFPTIFGGMCNQPEDRLAECRDEIQDSQLDVLREVRRFRRGQT